MMDRRGFLRTVGFFSAPLALAAEPQPPRGAWRIGFLGDGPRADRAPIASKPFRDGLRELGYDEGQNVMLEERWSEDKAHTLLDHVAEFVRLKVDVIVTHGVRGT